MWASGVEINVMDLDAKPGQMGHNTRVAGPTAVLPGMDDSSFQMVPCTWANGVETASTVMDHITWQMDHHTTANRFMVIEMALEWRPAPPQRIALGRRTGVSSAVGRRTNMCVVYINTLPRCLACDLFLLRLRVITPQEGLGIGKWDEGSRYVGQWRAGISAGYGILTSEGGSRSYRGQFVQAKKHGRGIYTWPDGRRGTKEFQVTRQSKHMKRSQGEHLGLYHMDFAFGFGTLRWPDGRRYHSFWRNARTAGTERQTG
eukprot:g1993.t1